MSRALLPARGAVPFRLPQFPTPGHGDGAQLPLPPSENLQESFLAPIPQHRGDSCLCLLAAHPLGAECVWTSLPAAEGVDLGRAGVCPSLVWLLTPTREPGSLCMSLYGDKQLQECWWEGR